MIRIFKLFAALAIAILLAGCTNPLGSGGVGALPITISTDTFIIAWDAAEAAIPDIPSAVDHFNLYYKSPLSDTWQPLKSTASFALSTPVSRWDFEDSGSYIIGIEEVYNDGSTSTIHMSTDFSAKPAGGWYLVLED